MNQRLNDFSSLRTHPFSIMMYLFLASLTMIFVGLTASYMYTRFDSHQPPIKIPFLFLFNTVVLYSSSWLLGEAKKKYESDDTHGYQRMLLFTILVTFLFMGLQYIGWEILVKENPNFFLIFFYKALTRMRDPVTVLIYFTDPIKQLQLKLLSRYWHFLDYLWIYLMFFFWINYFVQF